MSLVFLYMCSDSFLLFEPIVDMVKSLKGIESNVSKTLMQESLNKEKRQPSKMVVSCSKWSPQIL